MKKQCFLSLIVSFILTSGGAQTPNPRKGDQAPQISFDKSFPEDYILPNKKPILLDFWATWCGPCIAGLIESNRLVDQYDIDFIAITDSSSKRVEDFIQSRDFKHTFVIDSTGKTFKDYGVTGIPHAFLIDSDNVIQWEGHARLLSEDMIREFLSTGKVDGKMDRDGFDKRRFENVPKSTEEYELVIVDKHKLAQNKSILISKDGSSMGGNYSNAPEAEKVLTVINYDLNRLNKRIEGYFEYITLQSNINELQGYDFIGIPMLDFEELNSYLTENYGIRYESKK